MAVKTPKEFLATGRRKTSIARVRLSNGSGKIVINNSAFETYFGSESLRLHVQKAFAAAGMGDTLNVAASINGGGSAGQAVALQHGISRALIAMNPDLRKPLKLAGLLTRDSREKERRKVGCRKARKRPQYSKR